MKPVDQTIISLTTGNCMQAVLASLFERTLEDTVNPIAFEEEDDWYPAMMKWVAEQGYKYNGIFSHLEEQESLADLKRLDGVDGFFFGVVPSKTFEGASHAVIINKQGMVALDPNPNKLWQGINVVKSGELSYWYDFEKVTT